MDNMSSEGEQQPIRIVLADDYPVVRSGIIATLAGLEDIEVVGEASTGEQAVRLVDRLHPDVVVMDVMMPGMGGIAAIEVVHDRHPAVAVLALSSFEDGDLVHQARDAGALAYLLKSMEADELVRAIRLAYRGMPSPTAEAAQTRL